MKFGARRRAPAGELLDQRVSAGGLRDWAPQRLRRLRQLRPLHVVGTRGFPWTEIDFPEDYERAVREILPAIEGEDVIAGDGADVEHDRHRAAGRDHRRPPRQDAPGSGTMPLSPASGE